MKTRLLGLRRLHVSALGMGCMGMSDLDGAADEVESTATIHAAPEGGVTLVNTADFYGIGQNELLLRDALRGRARDRVVLSATFGALRDPAGGWTGVDARPTAVKNFLAYTLRRLGTGAWRRTASYAGAGGNLSGRLSHQRPDSGCRTGL